MLREAIDAPTLNHPERHALDILVDLSRVLPADPAVDVVTLRVVGDSSSTPSLAQAESRGWLIEAGDGEVRLDRALLRLVIDVAGQQAEYRAPQRDRFERVPSDALPVVQGHVERRPVISLAAKVLRDAVRNAAGRRPVQLLAPWPDGKRWAVALSHDLDVVDKWPVFTMLRVIELARKGEIRKLARVLAAAALAAPRRPTEQGVSDVLRIERAHGVRSSWFILCGTPTFKTMRAGDLTYVPERGATRRILGEIVAAGHEVGLHGSFDTFKNSALFAEQRARLERLVGRRVNGVRQHYLRMEPGATQRAMRDASLEYDSTCGFADRNGFRLGIADAFAAWDPEVGKPVGLTEVPFVWMDRALSKYQGIEDPRRWVDDGLDLADACRAIEGLWVGIWHPNLTPALGFPGAVDAYDVLVRSLVERDPYVAPIGDLARWRAARARVRARALRADGGVDVDVPVASDMSFGLEDAAGKTVQQLSGAG